MKQKRWKNDKGLVIFLKNMVFSLIMLSAVCMVVACSHTEKSDQLTIAATAVPHGEILEQVVKPELAKEGITLNVRIFNDYVQPNALVDQHQIDANYFQTLPFLKQYNKDHHSNLVPIVGVHIEPMGAYSRHYTSIAALPEGAHVAIPNDPSNEARALLLLSKAGLIQLKDASNSLVTEDDISANPKKLVFQTLDAAMLPRVLDQVDLAVINTNYALDAHLSPLKDALILEDKDSPYVNYLVARSDNKDDPRIVKLKQALTSQKVKAFIEKQYQNAIIPAF